MGDSVEQRPSLEPHDEDEVDAEIPAGSASPQSAQVPSDAKCLHFSAVADATIRSLARQLKELHSRSDVILKAGQKSPGAPEKSFACNSLIVATWSSSFRALLGEDKDEAGCRTIELKGDRRVIEDSLVFMKEGRCCFSVMGLNERHPILEFASEYGLDDLKLTYGEAMMCQDPVTLENASTYLELGLRFSMVNLSLVAADLLASNVGQLPRLNETILILDAACFRAVLASNALSVEDEQDVIEIIKTWVDKDFGQRASEVPSLLSQVRLSLCSYQSLIDLLSNLMGDFWKGVDEEHLRVRVRQVIDEKLQGQRLSDRQRHRTKLPQGEIEERLATTLKVSKGLYATQEFTR